MNSNPLSTPPSSEESWDELVQCHLISTNNFSGIAVLTKTGTCVYSYGKLATRIEQNWKHFADIFTDTSCKALDAVPKLSLNLDEQSVSFVTFKKTLSSLYATSGGNLYNVIVCSFPLGVLVCISEPPTQLNSSVTVVENFCALLRK